MIRHLPALLRILWIAIFITISSRDVSAVLISYVWGFVTDPAGNPVPDADLDFDNAITGERIPTPGDNTDPSGFYALWVPNGIYNISYAPPPGTHLLGYQIFDVSLSGSDVQIDVVLNLGKVLSGNASANGLPLANVDLDADHLVTGQRIYTPNDATDSLGNYWIVVPAGEYRIRYQPPAGSRWLPIQLDTVSILTDRVLDVTFSEGWVLNGHVTDGFSAGIDSIAVDLRDMATGAKIYLTNNESDSTGWYNVAVPPGLFQLRYVPPLGSRYVGAAIDSFTIGSDISRDQALQAGWRISVVVHDSTGAGIANSDLDFIQESTGIKLYTPNDATDSLGSTIITVPADTYTIRVQPPPGSVYDRLVLNGVTISADTSIDCLLPEVPRVHVAGRIVNDIGDGLPGIEINFADTVAGSRIYVADNLTDTLGFYNLFVPIGGFDVKIDPPRGSFYAGTRLGRVIIENDSTWDNIVLSDGIVVSALVLDPAGLPVNGADFDFILENSGTLIYTPHDNTDAAGMADITVPPGVYTINITPPVASSLEQQLMTGVQVTSDTSVTVFLAAAGQSPPVSFILHENFPDPFNGGTTISYVLFVKTDVSLAVYNTLGQKLTSMERANQAPGFYTMNWDGTDGRGHSAASGLYFYQLKTSMGASARSMLLVR